MLELVLGKNQAHERSCSERITERNQTVTYRFDQHTSLNPQRAGIYHAELTNAWNIGTVPNGGYQVAVCCQAALRELGSIDIINVSTYFLSPTSPGTAEIRVEVVKRGRSTSVAQVTLVQNSRERLRALVLAGDLSTLNGLTLHQTLAPELPKPEDCDRLTSELKVAPRLMNEVEVRLDPKTSGFVRNQTGQPTELRCWMRFADNRPLDVLALTCFADVLPPTIFNHTGVTGWVPTLELSTQIRARPVPGWLRVSMVTKHVTTGHFEEDGEFWDSNGTLVALSRQRALLLGLRFVIGMVHFRLGLSFNFPIYPTLYPASTLPFSHKLTFLLNIASIQGKFYGLHARTLLAATILGMHGHLFQNEAF
jgi:acyl-CoA thioesterase